MLLRSVAGPIENPVLPHRFVGQQPDAAISILAWTRVSLILRVILATIIVSEWESAKIHHAKIGVAASTG